MTHHRFLNCLWTGAPCWFQAGGTWQGLGIAVWAKRPQTRRSLCPKLCFPPQRGVSDHRVQLPTWRVVPFPEMGSTALPGVLDCSRRAPRGLGLLSREETPRSASAGWKGWAANVCQLTQSHQSRSSCTALVASFLPFLTAQILNPFEERRSGAFHHRKTNTFLILATAKLQNLTPGCSTNNRGKAFLFSLEIPPLLHAVSRLRGPDILCIAAVSKPPCDGIHPGASKQQVHKQTLASNKKG